VYVRYAESFLGDAVDAYGTVAAADVLAAAGDWAHGLQAQAARLAAAPRGPAWLPALLRLFAGTSAQARTYHRLARICMARLPVSGSGGWLRDAQRNLEVAAMLAHTAAACAAAADPHLLRPSAEEVAAAVDALLQVACAAFRTAAAAAAARLPAEMLQLAQADAGRRRGEEVASLAAAHLDAVAAALDAARDPALLLRHAAALRQLSLAACQSLLPLTSLALSSGMQPPPELLQRLLAGGGAAALRAAAHSGLDRPQPGCPPAAQRALWVALSDLSLRSWPTGAAVFDPGARGRAFAELTAPLCAALQRAGDQLRAAGGGGGGAPAHRALRRAAAAAAGVVHTYGGAPKAVRDVAYAALGAPLLRHCADCLGSPCEAARGPTAAALVRLLSAVLCVMGAELGAAGAGQLLQAVAAGAAAGGGDPTFEADLGLLGLLGEVLGQGGSRHRHLAPAALDCAGGVWARASRPEAAHAADVVHVKVRFSSQTCMQRRPPAGAFVEFVGLRHAFGFNPVPPLTPPAQAAALASMLSTLRHNWASLAGAAAPAAAPAAGAAVRLAVELFSAAAEGRAVLGAADARRVLESLFELHVVGKLYASPHMAPARAELTDALLGMLLSRMHRAAQEPLVDTLHGLAAAGGWDEFREGFAPDFVARRLPWLGDARGGGVAAALAAGGADPCAFERAVLAFVNDVAFWEAAL
jgi:hypothetical protein